ncbi:hypothetical protein PM082_000102 [Marasmius tenuissimus]|nr:hypothetical protein PM082_000102 [Marasmius tenuissimus]
MNIGRGNLPIIRKLIHAQLAHLITSGVHGPLTIVFMPHFDLTARLQDDTLRSHTRWEDADRVFGNLSLASRPSATLLNNFVTRTLNSGCATSPVVRHSHNPIAVC